MKTPTFCRRAADPRDGAPARRGRRRAVLGILALVAMVSGCVPIPYRPAAAVTHAPIDGEEAAAITLSAAPKGMRLNRVAKSIQQAEPRVILVDSAQYLNSLLPGGHGTLSDVLAANEASAAPAADYLLCVGSANHKQLHDTGLAAPFPYLPVIWVGYEKVQSRDSVSASLVDLHAPPGADGLLVASTYSEFIASLVYGVATIAMPEGALRKALAEDVAHTLARAHPTGAIRLVVLVQESRGAPDPVVAAANPTTP
jgi:hypothetical protein